MKRSTAEVQLLGPQLLRVVRGIPLVRERTREEPVIIGGLAVLCRLSQAYRTTTDLDTVCRRQADQASQLELLVAFDDTRLDDASGVVLDLDGGELKVDVLEVNPAELEYPSDDPTDRLHAMAHAWAYDSATSMRLVADDLRGQSSETSVLVAEPGPLVAMKLKAAVERGRDKESTDLLDIVRIVLDRGAGVTAREQLRGADLSLKADALLHARRLFVEKADATVRKVQRIPEGRSENTDTIDLVGEILEASLAPTLGV